MNKTTLSYAGTGLLVCVAFRPVAGVVTNEPTSRVKAVAANGYAMTGQIFTERQLEEAAAARKAAAHPLSNAKLKKLAAKYKPPAEWWAQDED